MSSITRKKSVWLQKPNFLTQFWHITTLKLDNVKEPLWRRSILVYDKVGVYHQEYMRPES